MSSSRFLSSRRLFPTRAAVPRRLASVSILRFVRCSVQRVGLLLASCSLISGAAHASSESPVVNLVQDTPWRTRQLIEGLEASGVSVRSISGERAPYVEGPTIWTGWSHGARRALVMSKLPQFADQFAGLILFSPPLFPEGRSGYTGTAFDEDLAKLAGPEGFLRDTRVRTLVVHGADDEIISPVYVERFARHPSNTGVEALFLVGKGHTPFDGPQQAYIDHVAANLIADVAHGRKRVLPPEARVTVVTEPEVRATRGLAERGEPELWKKAPLERRGPRARP